MSIAHGLLLLSTSVQLPGQEFVSRPWRWSRAAGLEVGGFEMPEAGWRQVFPGLQEADWDSAEVSWLRRLQEIGWISFLPLVLHNEGGAMASCDYGLRARKLGVRVSLADLEGRVDRANEERDIFSVKLVEDLEPYLVDYALAKIVGDERRNRFSRWAAAAALDARGASSNNEMFARIVKDGLPDRQGRVELFAAAARVPGGADFIAGVDAGAMPDATTVLEEWRKLSLRLMSNRYLQAGGAISLQGFALMQMTADRPGQFPFELALKVGNWRVDHAILARRMTGQWSWWFTAGGVFQPEAIHYGLRSVGCDSTFAGGVVAGELFGWRYRITASELVAWQGDLPGACIAPESIEVPKKAGYPLWFVIPDDSSVGPLVGASGASLVGGLHPETSELVVQARCTEEDQADLLHRRWRVRQASAQARIDGLAQDNPPIEWNEVINSKPGLYEREKGLLALYEFVTRARSSVDGAAVRWRLNTASIPLLDVLRWQSVTFAALVRPW